MHKAYSYHPGTREFIGETEADRSPLEPDVILYPAFSTSLLPPSPGAHQAAVFQDGAWSLVADFRGQTYWLAGVPATISDLGVSPPDGSTTEPPAYVPRAVTMRQARLALLAAGKLGQIDAAIDSLPSPQKEAARIEWEYSQEVQRHKPLVLALAPALGLDDAALDALFVAASQL